MIYIKNTTEIQTVFIPRNELQKEAYITSTKTYEDGYREGLEDGKEQQKDQLLNLYVNENGVYEREDGWGRVEVAFEETEVKLQKKNINLRKGKTSVTYDEGYDGLSEVDIDATGYGEFEYNNGFANGRNSVNILKQKTINIEKNGEQTFYSFDDGVDGYKNVTVDVNVDVPTQKLTDKSISIDKNGDYVYYAVEDGVDGYNMVSINVDVPQEGGGGDCNIIEFQEYTLKAETEKVRASEYGADGFAEISIDAVDLCKQKYNEGFEEGKSQGGGETTTYPTIADIYNSEVNTEVTFKATVAGIYQNNTNYYLIVTDHTGAYSLNFRNECPVNVGDECVFTGVNRRNNTTLIRYMQVPTNYEVLSSNNYVVLPAEALSIKDTSEIYSPNDYGNTEIKYICFEGEIASITESNGMMRLNTPISEKAISLRSTKQEWRDNVKVGDVVKVYGFPQETNNYIFPTEMVKIGGEQELVLEDGTKLAYSTFQICPYNIDDKEDYSYFFYECTNLKEAPQIKSQIKNAHNMFGGCGSLLTAPSYDTSLAVDIGGMYGDCYNLTSVGSLDCSSLPNSIIGWEREADLFSGNQYHYLTDFGGLLNLKQVCDLRGLIALNEQSVINVFNGLYDFVKNGETPNDIQGKLYMSTFIQNLVDTYKYIAEAKGWTIIIG